MRVVVGEFDGLPSDSDEVTVVGGTVVRVFTLEVSVRVDVAVNNSVTCGRFHP
jgi:hypothetical protein